MKIKEENARRLIDIARTVKNPPWTMDEMKKVLKTLKTTSVVTLVV